MKAFNKVADGLRIDGVIEEIAANDELFGEFTARSDSPGSPHKAMTDIWVRYKDMEGLTDYSTMADEHDAVWLKDLAEVKRLCFEVMALVDGERLGGVLITKIPPEGKILPHVDSGWHADYYDKYYVPIKNEDGAVLCFESGIINPEIGDVWQFDNSKMHWVENKSKVDRIAMIICIKQEKYDRSGF